MKKTFFLYFKLALIFYASEIVAQPIVSHSVQVMTPGGIFDMVADNRGNKYSLANLDVNSGKSIGGQFTSINAVPMATCNAGGYFNLYFDPNSIWVSSAPMQTLICQIFADISNFIYSPLTNTLVNPNGFKINIYCTQNGNFTAQGSSFYLFPNNPTNPNQGLIDGTIYKAIQTGVDPYLNIPMTFSNSGNFYHGFVSVNPTYSWHTDITQVATNGTSDLYTTLLHEICHALGIGTLIDANGNSTLGSNNLYYQRYDKFLLDNSFNPLLTPTPTNCPNSNLAFTAPLTSIKPALCVNNSTQSNTTTCSLAAKFAGPTQTLNLYTPGCYEPGASLSHFEDLCTPAPQASTFCVNANTNSNNDLYYVVSNMPAISASPCQSKRFLKAEETLVLCALGYSLNGIYSCSVSFADIDQGNTGHSYSATCSPSNIIGMNDGLVSGVYVYTTTGTSISIPTAIILANDSPTTGLTVSCEEVVYTNTITLAAASVTGTNLVVTANAGSGLVLVKYLPKNSANQYGNAAYVFVYFLSNNCNPVNACNIIQNGSFENLITNTMTTQCGLLGPDLIPNAISCWEAYEGAPAVFTRSCTSSGSNYNLGINTIGSSPYIINSFNGAGNDRVLGLTYSTSNPLSTQALKNNLGSALVPTTAYKLSFMVNNPAGTINSSNAPVVISVATNTSFAFSQTSSFPSGLNAIADFTIPATSTWTQVTYTFTFSSPGSMNHSAFLIGVNGASTILTPSASIWCYIDEVSLVSLPSPSFAISNNTICGNQAISDLGQFASVTGTFSGVGVTQSGGLYHFNLNSSLSPGTYPIAFTYQHGGCYNTIYQLITVNTNTNYIFLNPASVCMSNPTINLVSLMANSTYSNGGLFSINGFTNSAVASFTSPGVNLASFSYTASAPAMCTNNSNTIAITVYSVPTTPSVFNGTTSINSYDLCISGSLSVSATGSGSVFTWQPGNINDYSISVSPTTTTIYTVSNFNHSVCPSTQTLSVNVFTNCCTSNSIIIPAFSQTAISSSYYPTGPLLISSDFTVQAGGIFNMSGDYYFTNTGKITIESGGEVYIDGAHLQACNTDMWQGIVVKNGAYLETRNICCSKDNLIEDAITSIDVLSQTTTTISPLLRVTNTTFNKNYIGINLASNTRTSSASDYFISSNVFTCRNLPTIPGTWPSVGASSTSTVTTAELRTEINTTNTLAAPYLAQNGFTITNLKSPYSNQRSHIAINISSVGVLSGTTMVAPVIGSTVNASDFNLFDAHGNFIIIKQSNLALYNNVFQNTQTYSISSGTNTINYGGNAITHSVSNALNTALIMNASSISLGNRFWDCHKAIEAKNLYRFWLENATVRSTQNSATTSTLNSPGNYGIDVATNRFQYYIANNEFTNIKNATNVGIAAGSYTPFCFTCSGYGVYAHTIRIVHNTFSAGTGTNTFMDQAVLIQGQNTSSWASPTVNTVPFTAGISIDNNTLTNVNRGIYLNGNGAGFPSKMENNTITLANDNGNPQKGISVEHTYGKCYIVNNNLSATSTTNTAQSLFYFSINSGLISPSVSCNTATNCNKGFEFNSTNGIATTPSLCTYWRGNEMESLSVGMILTGTNAVIGPQGNTGFPIDNQWKGNWSGNYGVYNATLTNAQDSKLTVKTGTPWAIPSYTGGNVNAFQNYGAFGTVFTTTLGDYHCGQFSTNRTVSTQTFLTEEAMYISNTALYRYLYFNDSLRNANPDLEDFFNSKIDSSYDIFMQIEDKLYQGYLAEASTLINDVDASTLINNVEINYLEYYRLYLNYSGNIFEKTTLDDSLALLALANLCPANSGACVLQSRALYCYVYHTPYVFEDNCEIESTRIRKPDHINNETELKNYWQISLFPNPASNKIILHSNVNNEVLHVIIKDLSNRVLEQQDLKISSFIADLDLNLMNGVYLVTLINSKNENVTKKVVVAK
jgi:hypothetical protein